jgi:hypothetical protein
MPGPYARERLVDASEADRGGRNPSLGSQRPSAGRSQAAGGLQEVLQLAGNAAVASAIRGLQRAVQEPQPAAGPPNWSQDELLAVRRELHRLGLVPAQPAGLPWPETESGLVEAFGSDDWRGLPAGEITNRLRAAAPLAGGKPGEHHLRFGEMFRDGVLDITVSVGFLEEPIHVGVEGELEDLRAALAARQFVADRADAAKLMAQAKRTLGPSATGEYYVRRNALTYHPPAGPPRQIHAVVRVIDSGEGTRGSTNVAAIEESVAQSDVTTYSGHGRFGSGPDFNRNFDKLELLDERGNVTHSFPGYLELEKELTAEGRPHGRSAWEQFCWRDAQHRVNVVAAHDGNVFLNPQQTHPTEFGSQLMYWSLHRDGRALATGPGGTLAAGVAAAQPDHRYRVLLFDGCRTQDYVQSIRATPGLDARSTDVLGTRRVTSWMGMADRIVSFLDSMISQHSAEETIRGLDAQERPTGGTVAGFGLDDNPVYQRPAPAAPAGRPTQKPPAKAN